MEAFLQFAGMAGAPTTLVGFLLFLYFTVRKQEAVVRTEQLELIERQKTENAELRARIDDLEDQEIELRREMNDKEAEARKECLQRDLIINKLKIKLIQLGWEEESQDGT